MRDSSRFKKGMHCRGSIARAHVSISMGPRDSRAHASISIGPRVSRAQTSMACSVQLLGHGAKINKYELQLFLSGHFLHTSTSCRMAGITCSGMLCNSHCLCQIGHDQHETACVALGRATGILQGGLYYANIGEMAEWAHHQSRSEQAIRSSGRK